MEINTKNIVSITEANQNFSKVTRLVDENGTAIILKNNSPKYVLLEFSELEALEHQVDESVDQVAKRVLAANLEAFRKLSK